MARPSILQPDESYTFSKYFELAFDAEDILAELGCRLDRTDLTLPRYAGHLDYRDLMRRIEQNLTFADPSSEAARREILIAPILLELCRLTDSRLKIEYPIAVNNRLKGTIDYYVHSAQAFIVVEAKNADLGRGFTQLAVELIAFDQWTTSTHPMLYGAVTTGDIWRFGQFQRQEKTIVQDISLYRVPADLEELLRILMGILRPVEERAIV